MIRRAPVGSVLRRCVDAGLGLVAVTDHNNIRGGLEARERGGLPVVGRGGNQVGAGGCYRVVSGGGGAAGVAGAGNG